MFGFRFVSSALCAVNNSTFTIVYIGLGSISMYKTSCKKVQSKKDAEW